MGKREFNMIGKNYIYDPKNEFLCEIEYNPKNKPRKFKKLGTYIR